MLEEARAELAGQSWPPSLLRPAQRVLWDRATVCEQLGCGWQRGRLFIPIRDSHDELRGVLRYAPRHDRAPKMLATPGTRLGLVPHPVREPSRWVILTEGPPDMISARSLGLPALAVPGVEAWEAEWAILLAGRRVSVIMDCDEAGRTAAGRIARDLEQAGVHGCIIDLAKSRADGYDLTDWLYEHRAWLVCRIRHALGDRD